MLVIRELTEGLFAGRHDPMEESDAKKLRQLGAFEPEVSLAVLPTAQSETPVPPKSATVILAQGRERVRHALPQKPFRIAERPASIRSPPLVANAEFSPQPPEVVGAHRILGTLLR